MISRTNSIIKNRYKYEVLRYLDEQFSMGFNPRWLVTWHLYNPDELIKHQEEIRKLYGHGSRYGSNQELWKIVDRQKWIKKRRRDIFRIYEDTRKICNVEMKMFYGVKRFNRLHKYQDTIQPMLYFHEMGQARNQYHCHHVLSAVPEINDKESLSHLFNNKIRNKTRCISGWKKIDVRPIYDEEDLMGYLTKETNIKHLSLDPYSKVIDKKSRMVI